jgi:hypothetical protein
MDSTISSIWSNRNMDGATEDSTMVWTSRTVGEGIYVVCILFYVDGTALSSEEYGSRSIGDWYRYLHVLGVISSMDHLGMV